MIKILKITTAFFISIFLYACNPDSSEMNIYTSDFDLVKKNEIVEIPIKLSFQLLGDDKGNTLEKSKNIASLFLHPDTKFSINQGQYTKDFVVETFIPMMKADNKNINTYFEKNKSLLSLYYYPKFTKKGSDKVELVFQDSFARSLNKKLFKINPMLSLSFPPKKMKFRIISDSKDEKKIGAYSVWISKKPFISKLLTLKRREEIEFLFKGGSSSVYSSIRPQIYIIN